MPTNETLMRWGYLKFLANTRSRTGSPRPPSGQQNDSTRARALGHLNIIGPLEASNIDSVEAELRGLAADHLAHPDPADLPLSPIPISVDKGHRSLMLPRAVKAGGTGHRLFPSSLCMVDLSRSASAPGENEQHDYIPLRAGAPDGPPSRAVSFIEGSASSGDRGDSITPIAPRLSPLETGCCDYQRSPWKKNCQSARTTVEKLIPDLVNLTFAGGPHDLKDSISGDKRSSISPLDLQNPFFSAYQQLRLSSNDNVEVFVGPSEASRPMDQTKSERDRRSGHGSMAVFPTTKVNGGERNAQPFVQLGLVRVMFCAGYLLLCMIWLLFIAWISTV